MKTTKKRLSFERLEQRQLLAAVSIPSDLSGQVASLVSAPVSIDNAAGIRGATIRVAYDPNVLMLTQENVSLGTVWAGSSDTQLTANVNQATGTVVVFLSASTDLTASGGSLVQFGFVVREGVAGGTLSRIDLTEVRLNEGTIPVNPLPVAGVDSTDGSISVVTGTPDLPSGLAQVSGVVYADSNADLSPSAFEGIPGVLVSLLNVSSGISQQATTASDGSYRFTNLTPGSYRIIQSHPRAFIDGGQNQLDLSLAPNQIASSQNFREIGLRPEFVSNRFLMTLVMPVGSDSWQTAVSQMAQLTINIPVLNTISTAGIETNMVTNNGIPNRASAPPALSSFSLLQAEGEGKQPMADRILASQASMHAVPQSIRRTKTKGNVDFVDEAMTSLLAFE